MLRVTLYKGSPTRGTTEGTARTDDPREAIRRVGARKLGYTKGIGLCQHFPGGGTYHVQFVEADTHGISLSDRYVAQVERA
jgi:hypothetical protein